MPKPIVIVAHWQTATEDRRTVLGLADRAALDAHLDSTHYQELVAGRMRPLLTGRQVTVLGAVDLPTP